MAQTCMNNELIRRSDINILDIIVTFVPCAMLGIATALHYFINIHIIYNLCHYIRAKAL